MQQIEKEKEKEKENEDEDEDEDEFLLEPTYYYYCLSLTILSIMNPSPHQSLARIEIPGVAPACHEATFFLIPFFPQPSFSSHTHSPLLIFKFLTISLFHFFTFSLLHIFHLLSSSSS